MKVLIMGASGSGTTTIGKALATKFGFKHLDVDDYYWKKTDLPFQEKVSPQKRKSNLIRDFKSTNQVFVSGSLVSWGNEWLRVFDLVVFNQIAPELRMKRLLDREVERYGSRLETDYQVKETSKAFIEWARNYDDPSFDGRSVYIHQEWISKLSCPVLTIDGALPLSDNIRQITSKINTL